MTLAVACGCAASVSPRPDGVSDETSADAATVKNLPAGEELTGLATALDGAATAVEQVQEGVCSVLPGADPLSEDTARWEDANTLGEYYLSKFVGIEPYGMWDFSGDELTHILAIAGSLNLEALRAASVRLGNLGVGRAALNASNQTVAAAASRWYRYLLSLGHTHNSAVSALGEWVIRTGEVPVHMSRIGQALGRTTGAVRALTRLVNGVLRVLSRALLGYEATVQSCNTVAVGITSLRWAAQAVRNLAATRDVRAWSAATCQRLDTHQDPEVRGGAQSLDWCAPFRCTIRCTSAGQFTEIHPDVASCRASANERSLAMRDNCTCNQTYCE